MALPTITELKRRLRIQGNAEDTDLTAMMASAYGTVQAHVKRPLVAIATTMILEPPDWIAERGSNRIVLPLSPVASSPALTFTDVDGTVISTSDYRLDLRTGILTGAVNIWFSRFPYTVVATVGLSARADYALVVEPVLSAAIIDHAAALWHQRNPNATNEAAGGGISSSYQQEYGLSPRLCAMLEPFVLHRAR